MPGVLTSPNRNAGKGLHESGRRWEGRARHSRKREKVTDDAAFLKERLHGNAGRGWSRLEPKSDRPIRVRGRSKGKVFKAKRRKILGVWREGGGRGGRLHAGEVWGWGPVKRGGEVGDGTEGARGAKRRAEEKKDIRIGKKRGDRSGTQEDTSK